MDNFSSVCRLCLSENTSLNPILDSNYLAQKILVCLNVEVKDTDRITTLICKRCTLKVEEWYEFKNFCDDSQLKLHIWVNNSLYDRQETTIIIKEEIKIENEEIFIPPVTSFITNPPEESTEYSYFNEYSAYNSSDAEQVDSLLIPTYECPVYFHGLKQVGCYDNKIGSQISSETCNDELPDNDKKNCKPTDVCKICLKKFSTYYNRIRHERAVHPDEMSDTSEEIDAPEPESSVEANNELENMLFNPMDENEFVLHCRRMYKILQSKRCDCCDKKFYTRKAVTWHLKKKFNIEPFTCFLCCICFPNRSQYMGHKSKQDCLKRLKLLKSKNCSFKAYEHYRCGRCNTFYGQKSYAMHHILNSHVPQAYPASCTECNAELLSNTDFSNHIREKCCMLQVHCSICKINFDNPNAFRTHTAIHGESVATLEDFNVSEISETEYETDYDGVSQSNVESSDTIPNAKKELMECSCQICGRNYVSFVNLKRHFRLNHKNYRYILCKICCNVFLDKRLLKMHLSRCHKPGENNKLNLINEREQNEYICGECNYSCVTIKDFDDHLYLHECNEEDYACEHCKQKFDSSSDLDNHNCQQFNLKLKLYRCSNSNSYKATTNFTPASLDTNKNQKPDEKPNVIMDESQHPFKCNFCDKSYTRYTSLHKHNRVKHLKTINYRANKKACSICQKLFPTLKALLFHRKKMHFSNIPSAAPSKIIKKFKTKNYKYSFDFLKSDSMGQTYQCKICKKILTKFKGLAPHFRSHQISYKCKICHAIFNNLKALTSHEEQKHPKRNVDVNIINFPCTICKKIVSTASALKNHMKVHNLLEKETKEFWCKVCKRSFLTRAAIVAHSKTHMAKKSVLNKIVPPKIVPNKTSPNKIVSNKILKFKCKKCHKMFSTMRGLNVHVNKCSNKPTELPPDKPAKTNTDVQPSKFVSCNVCTRMFAHKGLLTNHFKSHFHQTPTNKCKFCNIIFTSWVDLVQHSKACVCVKDVSVCLECGKSFNGPVSLIRHKNWHNKINAQKKAEKSNGTKVSIHENGKRMKVKLQRRDSYKYKVKVKKLMRKKLVHVCTLCNTSFSSAKSLRVHNAKHVDNN